MSHISPNDPRYFHTPWSNYWVPNCFGQYGYDPTQYGIHPYEDYYDDYRGREEMDKEDNLVSTLVACGLGVVALAGTALAVVNIVKAFKAEK